MNLLEAFVKLDEDAFDTTPKGIEDLSNFMDDADVVDDEIEIIDPDIDFGDDDTMPADDEESEEENAHVGQLVLQCNTCNALVYKDKDEVELDEEGNVEEEECPNCHNVSKFDVIGKICTVDDLEDELEGDEEESEEKEEDESEKPEEESKEEVEVDDEEEEEKPIKEESLRRPNKNKRLVEAPAGDFSYFKSNGNDEMSYNRDDLRYAKSLLKRHYLDKVHTSSMDDFSRNIAILNDSVKFVEEEFNQDIKPSGSIPRYKDLNQVGPVNTICNGYLDLCDDIEKSFNDCYYIGFDSCRDGDDKYIQTPPGLDYTATFSIFDESCIFKIRTTSEGIEEYTRFINLPDSVNCKNTYKLAENIVSLIPELKHQFFTFSERKLDEISIRLNQGLDRSLFTFIPLDELREKIKGAMVLKESLRRPRKIREAFEIDDSIIKEAEDIVNNADLTMTSIEEDGDEGGYIEITDKNSGMNFWIEYWSSNGDWDMDWNQYIFYNNHEDKLRKAIQEDSDFASWAFDIVRDNLPMPVDESLKKSRKRKSCKESLRRPNKKSLKEDVEQPDFDVEPDETVIYLFPKLEPEDISVAEDFDLSVDNEYGDDVDTALIGKFKDLKNFATNYLDYQLVDGYLLDKDGMRIPAEETFRKFQNRKNKNKKYPGFDESLRRKHRKISEKFTKKSSPKDKILKDIKRLKKESLKESISSDDIIDEIKSIVRNWGGTYIYDIKKKNNSIRFTTYGSDLDHGMIKHDIFDFLDKKGYSNIKTDYWFDNFDDDELTFFEISFTEPNTNESLKEDLEGVTVDTDSETIQITQKEDGGVAVETSPKASDESFMEEPMFEEPPMEGDEVSGDEEVIEPLTDEEEEEIAEENPESEDDKEDEGDEDEEEIEDIDSDSFDELGESYLKEAYENVKSFKTNKVYKKNGKLVVEGIVSFKSGKNKKTSFIFESAHNKSKKKVLLGENKQITPNSKSFRLRGAVKNKKMVCESLRYNYKEGKNRVSGICRVK